MKKLFQIIGCISLMGFSFFYTEKTVSVVKEYDDIMINIKKDKNEFEIKPIEAVITKNTIIPGSSGKKVNINKSYSKMKKYGMYEKSLFVIEKSFPKDLIKDNKNKYIISGNKNNKKVTLIFLVKDNDDINEIVNILDKKNIKANFFIDGNWMIKNTNLVPVLIKKKYIIGNLSNKNDYNDSMYNWEDTIIKKIGKQKNDYCYSEHIDENILSKCSLSDNYSIIPNIIIKNNYFIEVKNKIKNGSIISMNISKKLEKELPLIISYINSRGYKIEALDLFLKE